MTHPMIPRRFRRSAFPALWDVRTTDRIFDELWPGLAARPAGAGTAGFTPRVNVRETDEALTLSAELPGLEEKDFDVSIENDVLTLKGEKRSHSQEEVEGYRRIETVSGRFERRFALPESVDIDAVKAAYKAGVLTLTLPKRPEPQPEVRSVPVTTA